MKRVVGGFLLLLAVMLVSCGGNHTSHRSSSSDETLGPVDTTRTDERKPVSDFKSVAVYDASVVDIRLCADSAYSVKVNGSKTYVEAQEAEVKGEEMVLKFDNQAAGKRKTQVTITAPTLQGVKVVNCGKLMVGGELVACSNFVLNLEKVNVAQINPMISASYVEARLAHVMFAEFRIDCDALLLSTKSVGHAKVFGKAKKQKLEVDRMESLDLTGLAK